MIRTSPRFTAIVLAAALVAASAFAANAVAAGAGTVNGKPISQNQIDFIVTALKQQQGRPDSPDLRKEAREIVIRQQLLMQEAQKQGIDKKPDVQARVDMARQGVLLDAFAANYIASHPISEDSLKKEFESWKAARGDKEYKVRHILVDSEDQAKDIIAKLKKGEKFENLASQSKDGTKDKGGDLGWVTPGNFVKPFADAMVKLNKGQYTETPVQSEYGWHVIQLDDTRALAVPSYDEAKGQFTNALQRRMLDQYIADLRKNAKVTD
jgi:peptidyl-prolyl cis-trans isomerase C